MLITTCTHCLARFRVTPQQLNEKQGQVRCGRCRQVFSGFEALERFPDDDTGTRLLADREAETGEKAEALADFDEAPRAEEPPKGAPPPAPTPTPTPARTMIEPPSTPPSRPMVEPPAPTPSRPLTPRARPVFEPAPPVREPPSRAWAYGAVLLFVVLLAELAFGFRAPLAQRYPVLRPWLEAACARAGCTVPWPREDALLKLEDSELLEVPGRANEIALGARIRNLASFAQEYPYIELTLTDTTGQPAVRRVLRPPDYLGRAVNAGEALPAGADLPIQLRLETPRVRATGYELLLFYP
ncbi:MAG TPA: zinc-ribbon and DUF3426 domain-containing protein [Usitatibacter sp.]|nr:zinc-ribbon and DUF3426 domain-containing protein [Usitatibacter sp.]